MKFDGIFAWNDYVAVQVLNSLYGTGVRVPEDIQLIGFDNTYLGSIFTPSLTTISQDIDQIGERAMKSLVNAISDSKNFQTQILVDVELIQRCTTRNPAIMRKNA
jgi:DNA-binding LacI/PurR family transcriptional regulator